VCELQGREEKLMDLWLIEEMAGVVLSTETVGGVWRKTAGEGRRRLGSAWGRRGSFVSV